MLSHLLWWWWSSDDDNRNKFRGKQQKTVCLTMCFPSTYIFLAYLTFHITYFFVSSSLCFLLFPDLFHFLHLFFFLLDMLMLSSLEKVKDKRHDWYIVIMTIFRCQDQFISLVAGFVSVVVLIIFLFVLTWLILFGVMRDSSSGKSKNIFLCNWNITLFYL